MKTNEVETNVAAAAALKLWYEGFDARAAVERYLGNRPDNRETARAVIGRLRARWAELARSKGLDEQAALFEVPAAERTRFASKMADAMSIVANTPTKAPGRDDKVSSWLSVRLARPLEKAGLGTLGALADKANEHPAWWTQVEGLGKLGAQSVIDFLKKHPQVGLFGAGVVVFDDTDQTLVPLERFAVTSETSGAHGRYRGPQALCTLAATNDVEAVQAWLARYESEHTKRSYGKEAERLLLWSRDQLGKPISSLTAEDAIAYRDFLLDPQPRWRWVGPSRPRTSPAWRAFQGPLSPASAKFSVSVLGSLYSWLKDHGYLLSNPFSGLKVRGGVQAWDPLQRAFGKSVWAMLKGVADMLEIRHGWEPAAAQRIRFILEFGYATGLRESELVQARLRDFHEVEGEGWWLNVEGKGSKRGRVVVPPSALRAVNGYLEARGLAPLEVQLGSDIPLIGRLADDGRADAISAKRLWKLMKRFFLTAAAYAQEQGSAGLADNFRKASVHWMRHTHAFHAMNNGADIRDLRENLRHKSLQTSSVYARGDNKARAQRLSRAFE